MYIKAKIPLMLVVLFSNPRNTIKENIFKFFFLSQVLKVKLVGRKEKRGQISLNNPQMNQKQPCKKIGKYKHVKFNSFTFSSFAVSHVHAINTGRRLKKKNLFSRWCLLRANVYCVVCITAASGCFLRDWLCIASSAQQDRIQHITVRMHRLSTTLETVPSSLGQPRQKTKASLKWL